MSVSSLEYTPTEIWTPETPDLDESIQFALREMNSENPQALINDLTKRVGTSDNGVVYAVLNGNNPEEYSKSEALVMFNPFANTASPNMLVRSEFIRRVAKQESISDEEGKLKPVIMLASPGINGSKLSFNFDDRERINKGDLGPFAKELLTSVSYLDVGRVSLLGFSQGADVALSGAEIATSANLDVDAVSVGDPAGIEHRIRPHLVFDFLRATNLEPAMDRTALDAQGKAMQAEPMRRFVQSALDPINMSLYKALGVPTFLSKAIQVLENVNLDNLVIGYGSNSAIAKPKIIEPQLESLRRRFGPESFVSIRVDRADHTWGDQLTLLAKLYMRALK